MEEKSKLSIVFFLKIILPLLIAILSFTVLSKYASSTIVHTNTITTLQEKQDTVLKLCASSTAIAAGSSLLLGDRATAVSNKLLDLTGYFIVILSAILLEKYLVTIMGLVSFKILIPIACIIFSIFTIVDRKHFRKLAARIVAFAIVAFLAIPSSVLISNVIENTYGNTINKTIEASENLKEEIEMSSEENTATNIDKEVIDDTDTKDEKEGGILGFFSNAKEKIASGIGSVVNTVTGKAKEWIDKLTTQLNNMIDAIAVMIVTTCVIPLLVIAFLIWVVKMLFSVDINVDPKKIPKLSELRK